MMKATIGRVGDEKALCYVLQYWKDCFITWWGRQKIDNQTTHTIICACQVPIPTTRKDFHPKLAPEVVPSMFVALDVV